MGYQDVLKGAKNIVSAKVFVSSTIKDLSGYRESIKKALLIAGCHPILMEDFASQPEKPIRVCLEEVARADLFIGIYAWRYGFIPTGERFSITNLEFLKAQELGKPSFIFMIDEDYPWPNKYRDKGSNGRLLREFKTQVELKIVRSTFTTPQDLQVKVLSSLVQHLFRQMKFCYFS